MEEKVKRTLLSFFLFSISMSICNAKGLEEFSKERVTLLDLGLSRLEVFFAEPIETSLGLYKEGFINGHDTSGYKVIVNVDFGPPALTDMDKIILKISQPSNMPFLEKVKGISRKAGERLALAYFNSVRERLGIQIKDDGSVDDQSWIYIGTWFSHRGATVEQKKAVARTVGENIILSTIIPNVSEVGPLFCEARGISKQVKCKAFSEL